ncbi:MAG: RNA polymerase sporulation sigma factor SigH [Firmicutes bacterium]|nr:RNA polymerase sporulation sigma factor SigH [Bacillota bacterium]
MPPVPADGNRVPDEELVDRARNGDSGAWEVLLARYQPLVRARARHYYLPGAEHEDLIQEGRIGLYKAIRDFNPGRSPAFRTFADLCVTRQILAAVKQAARLKHVPLNSSVSLDTPLTPAGEGAVRTLLDVLGGSNGLAGSDPLDQMVEEEELEAIATLLAGRLTDLEWRVLMDHISGISRPEIARRIHGSPKMVDNALQRVKRKLLASLSPDRRQAP